MPEEKSTKEFGGRVPDTEYEKFRSNFPQYGATNWFINAALKRFNQLCEEDHGVVGLVDKAIDTMLDETLSKKPVVANSAAAEDDDE